MEQLWFISWEQLANADEVSSGHAFIKEDASVPANEVATEAIKSIASQLGINPNSVVIKAFNKV